MRQAVLKLWQELSTSSSAAYRVYVEASALGLLGHGPYVTMMRGADAHWSRSMADYLTSGGAPAHKVSRMVSLVDATFMGLMLDLPLEGHVKRLQRAVTELAEAVAALGSA